MMSADGTVSHTAEDGNGGNKRTPCPLHGCKRVYTDVSALEAHIKDHDISAQSLPGKALLCSTVGCNGSFPNMQKLMEHMRHHHKPNIFFLCESCRTKLRSYRGLLTHLHTCSKVPRGKTKSTEVITHMPTGTNPNMAPMAMDQNPPRLDSSQEAPIQIPNPDGSFPASVPPEFAAPPVLGPPFMSNPETSPQQVTEVAPQPQLRNETSDLPPSPNQAGQTAALGPPDAQGQQQTQTRSPGSAPQSPPGSSAVWKKNQGMACNRRILWEHTKGRYTCVQCGHSVTNRKEMTQHINSQHSANKAAEDTGSSATNA